MRAEQEQRLQLRGRAITWEPEDIDHHYDDSDDDDDSYDNDGIMIMITLLSAITWEPEDIDHHYDEDDNDDSNGDDGDADDDD